jgi:hypothetical protein
MNPETVIHVGMNAAHIVAGRRSAGAVWEKCDAGERIVMARRRREKLR